MKKDGIIRIALTGRQRAGKDAAATHLIYKYGMDRLAFGDKLKILAHEIFPWVGRDEKPRDLYLFMNSMRDYDKGVWIKHVDRMYEHFTDKKSCNGVVITDVRQQNEFDWCKENGFTIVRITSPYEERKFRAESSGDRFKEEDLEHKTEQETDGFDVDYEVNNDGSMDDLWAKMDVVIGETEKGT